MCIKQTISPHATPMLIAGVLRKFAHSNSVNLTYTKVLYAAPAGYILPLSGCWIVFHQGSRYFRHSRLAGSREEVAWEKVLQLLG
jgi:hypothetical protein